LSFHGTLQWLYWTGVHSRIGRWQLNFSLTLTIQEVKCMQVNVMCVPLLCELYLKISDILFYSSTHFTYFTYYRNWGLCLIMTSFLSSDTYIAIEFVESKITTFFFRNSNDEFCVSVTIGLLCQTTDETLVTISGIQHQCDATDQVPPASPLNDTSTSDAWNAVHVIL
jgi:hypothetical protein